MRMLWITAWRNLWRNKRRTLILILAITIGLWGVLISMAWVNAWLDDTVKNSTSTTVGHVQLQAPGYYDNPQVRLNLPDDEKLLKQLSSLPTTKGAGARVRGQVLLSNAEKAEMGELVGADPTREGDLSVIPGHIVEGRWLKPGETGKIVVGQEFLKKFKTKIGRRVIIRGNNALGEISDAAFRIVGAYRTNLMQFDRRTAYVTLADAQKFFAVEGRVTEYVLTASSPQFSEQLKNEVTALALPPASEGKPIVVTTWLEQLPLVVKMMEMAGAFMWYFYAFFFVAMAFGIANSFLMVVHERRREIGMMLALGVRRRTVLGVLMIEAFLLAIVGSIVGNGIGVAVVAYLGKYGLDLSRWAEGMNQFGMSSVIYFFLRLEDVVTATLATAITCIAVTLYPAYKASRLRPVETLRST